MAPGHAFQIHALSVELNLVWYLAAEFTLNMVLLLIHVAFVTSTWKG